MKENMYLKRGVSADKQDVHAAILNTNKGLFKNSFCKILPDVLGNNEDFCTIMHSDTAGTKTILAYLYWRETGDSSVFEGVVQDALVMNIDDMACSGVVDNFMLSSTILRNKNHITAAVLKVLIEAQQKLADIMQLQGVSLHFAGGETADVGDVCRTLDVGFTATARVAKSSILDINIQPDDVVVGVASYGQAVYESEYNSGIGCNGLTSARHDMLDKYYYENYPESYDPINSSDCLYIGKHRLTDIDSTTSLPIGKLLLSPTRTYLPLLKRIFEQYPNQLHGIIHNTGGGMTKVLHFIDKIHVIKDNLLVVPPIFKLLNNETTDYTNEMFKVYNMGCRLEIYCPKSIADSIINIATTLCLEAQVIGYCKASSSKQVSIINDKKEFHYS